MAGDQTVEFEGQQHVFPADFSQDDIQKALSSLPNNSPPPTPPSMLSRIWGAATTPLIPQGRAEKEGLARATAPPTLADSPPEPLTGHAPDATNVSAHPVMSAIKNKLGIDPAALAAGAYADTLGMARSFTSPVSLALMGAGAASRALPATGTAANAARTALGGIEAGAGAGFGAQGAGQIVNAGTENTPEAWQQRLQGAGQIAGGAAGAADVANRALPGFHNQAGHFNAFEAAYGDRPSNTAKSLPKAQAVANRMTENKAMAVPGPVQTLIDQAAGKDLPKQPKIMGEDAEVFANKHPEAYQRMIDEGVVQPSPKPEPMTILQMRHLKTDLSNIMDSRDFPNTFKKPMVELQKAINQDIVDSLPNQTSKNWYEATNKEASRAYAAQRAGKAVAPLAGALAGYHAGRLLGMPLGAELTLGAIGHQAGKYGVGSMVDSVLNRDTGPIKIPRGAIPPPPK